MALITTGGTDGGSGSSPASLGTFSLSALAAGGPQTLFTPPAGSYAYLLPLPAGFADMDNGWFAEAGFLTATSLWQLRASFPPHVSPFGYAVGANVGDGSPVQLFAFTPATATRVAQAPGAWTANHAYATAALLNESGHVWSASSPGGTSGAIIPNFPGNFGGSIVDNDITWTDEGALPTVGAISFASYVLTPA